MSGPLILERQLIHRPVGQGLAADAPLSTGVPVEAFIALAGAQRWRVRIRASAAGTLSAAYVRAGRRTDVYAANNPADVAVVANTETAMSEATHFGAAAVRLTFTPSGNGAVTYCDIEAVGSPAA